MKIPIKVAYNHDGAMDFEVPHAVRVNPHHKDGYSPHYADAAKLLACYPKGSEIHVVFRLPEVQEFDWVYTEEAWVEVP